MQVRARAALAVLALVAALAVAPPRTLIARAAPPALPADRLHFGVSNFDATWLTGSGVPWRYRYTYIAGGVCYSGSPPGCADWTTWQDPALPPGQFVVDYIQNTPASTIPVFPYYMLLQSHRASDELSDDYANVNNAALMAAYYANFRLLLQKINSTGRTTVVHVEPDFWGYMQQYAMDHGDGTAGSVSASVASSGVADVSAYPNTIAGFGRALLHLRDLYAPNTAVMAVHASMWSSKVDVGSTIGTWFSATTEAAKTANFLNGTGSWDAVFDDVDDHDAGWWEQQGADNSSFTHWWDPTITDPAAAYPNFARYLAWVGQLHSVTGLPQVVWQVPMGNQYFLTMNNTCGHYQDNVEPYFIAHPQQLYAAGLVAVLLGAGNGCQTTNEDGQGDGVTNNNGTATTDSPGFCNACNTHTSVYADDDGGYTRIFVGLYYAAGTCAPGPVGQTRGYDILTSFGGIYTFGDACYYGNLIDHGYPGPAIGLGATPDDRGYAILTSFGGVYTFGDAQYYGNLIDHGYPGRAVSISYTPTGRGYAILTDSGALYTFGDAQYYGNLLDHGYPGPAASLSYTGDAAGYEILTSWGGMYTFGGAPYFGNLVDHHYPGPAAALANTN